MYTNDRDAYRQTFFQAWEKYKKNLPLETVEVLIVEVILLHPEYHALLEDPRLSQDQSFSLEDNPFVHMSLHISIREQINMDRPKGISLIYKNILAKYLAQHTTIHLMLDCLSQIMWESQQSGKPPDEQTYLERLRLI